MTVVNLPLEVFKSNTIFLFDLDDTLFYSYANVGYTILETGEKFWIHSSEFLEAKSYFERKGIDVEWDFSEFKYIEKLVDEVNLNKNVIDLWDNLIIKGYSVGILTARELSDKDKEFILKFMKYRNSSGELASIPRTVWKKDYIMGSLGGTVNKAEVMKEYFVEELGFDYAVLVDNERYNLDLVNNYMDDRIFAIDCNNRKLILNIIKLL